MNATPFKILIFLLLVVFLPGCKNDKKEPTEQETVERSIIGRWEVSGTEANNYFPLALYLFEEREIYFIDHNFSTNDTFIIELFNDGTAKESCNTADSRFYSRFSEFEGNIEATFQYEFGGELLKDVSTRLLKIGGPTHYRSLVNGQEFERVNRPIYFFLSFHSPDQFEINCLSSDVESCAFRGGSGSDFWGNFSGKRLD
ncbi:MAG: hypothetical protein GY866_14385 [Proteobacteria bacterium]|nr:hypothetical protein [Pseudomonadota bacterium]